MNAPTFSIEGKKSNRSFRDIGKFGRTHFIKALCSIHARMKSLLTILIFAISNLCYANFGGYYRYSTEGGGTILNSSNSQLIELVKEDISILLDQRVNFRAVFYLKNTSSEEQESTLAFPQVSYWDVPYKSGSGYSPENYYPLNEKLLINGNQIRCDEELYSSKFKGFEAQWYENSR